MAHQVDESTRWREDGQLGRDIMVSPACEMCFRRLEPGHLPRCYYAAGLIYPREYGLDVGPPPIYVLFSEGTSHYADHSNAREMVALHLGENIADPWTECELGEHCKLWTFRISSFVSGLKAMPSKQ